MTSDKRDYQVIGCHSNDIPNHIGFCATYEAAVRFKSEAEIIGWKNVAIFDANWQEVIQKP